MLAERDSGNEPEITIAEIHAATSAHKEGIQLQELRKQTKDDHAYQQLHHYILNGFPEHCKQLPQD